MLEMVSHLTKEETILFQQFNTFIDGWYGFRYVIEDHVCK